MAIEDIIPNVFGGVPSVYQGLLGAEDTASLQKRANLAGLLSAGAALAQGMSPQGYRRSPLQNILSAAAAGFGGAGQSYESGIKQMSDAQSFAQAQRKNQAIRQLLQDPKVANDPAMQAWIMSNPDKALEKYVTRRGLAEFMASELGQMPQMPTAQPTQQVAPPSISGEPPVEGQLPSVTVTGTQQQVKPYSKEIRDNELMAKYYRTVGDDVEKANKYQTSAENYRKLQAQEEAAGMVKESLTGLNPMLQPLADTLIANAPNMTTAELNSAMIDIRKKNTEFKVGTEKELRNEYNALPAVKEFSTVQTAFNQINSALSNPSAANDLAAATKFMKLLDPGSVVRESELGMAIASTGAIDRMQNYFQRLQNGQMLNAAQREDFKKSAQLAYNAAKSMKDQIDERYINLANSYNVDPNNIVLKNQKNSQQSQQNVPQTNKQGWRLSVDAKGNRAYVSPDGTQYEEVK